MTDYRLYGLAIRATLALPELTERPCDAPDVTIAEVPLVAPLGSDIRFEVDQEQRRALLEIPKVGRFRIAADRIEAEAASPGPVLRTYLFGSVFAVLLYLRRILPLHGAAMVRDGRVAILLGQSGAGKSTLAEHLSRTGWTLLADDVSALTRDADGGWWVQPGLGRARLCEDAWERAGRPAAERVALPDSSIKWVGPSPAGESPLRLAAIGLLAPGESEGADRLARAEALRTLMQHSYRGGMVPTLGLARWHFETCADVASQVPVWRLGRDARQDAATSLPLLAGRIAAIL